MAQSAKAADFGTGNNDGTTCDLCGSEVSCTKRTGPYAIDDAENTEFLFECEGCGESAHLLHMVGIGWEPCHFVSFDG